MCFIYIMVLHVKDTKKYTISAFSDECSAYISANWYNEYFGKFIHAEVLKIPLIECISIDAEKERIEYQYYEGLWR